MKPAPIPNDDDDRVADLHALNVLDTKREERFDRITDLVADVFGVKMCFVNMVDANRQWFKSTCGLQGVDETPREPGFCAHAIFEPDVMIVPDATQDQRFADNPFVTGDFGLCFYAGTVLRTATIGIVLYISAMWVSGILQGLMWRAYTSLGFLEYSFIETVEAMHPFYIIRAAGGGLFLIGSLIMAYNLWMTVRAGEAEVQSPVALQPAE